jgi:hypothetical protein
VSQIGIARYVPEHPILVPQPTKAVTHAKKLRREAATASVRAAPSTQTSRTPARTKQPSRTAGITFRTDIPYHRPAIGQIAGCAAPRSHRPIVACVAAALIQLARPSNERATDLEAPRAGYR